MPLFFSLLILLVSSIFLTESGLFIGLVFGLPNPVPKPASAGFSCQPFCRLWRCICIGEITMQHAIKCDSRDKPGKNEVIRFMPVNLGRFRDCPDCDRKRITACKDPACGRRK